MTFKELILTQNDEKKGLKNLIGCLLPHLDLGFLRLEEEAIEQFKTLLVREDMLHPYVEGHDQYYVGIGDLTFEELFAPSTTPQKIRKFEDVAPNRGVPDPQYTGKLDSISRSIFARKECDDVGDIVTVLNANRILWKSAFSVVPDAGCVRVGPSPSEAEASPEGAVAFAAAGAATVQYPCCCNNANHTIAKGYQEDFYRTCVDESGSPSSVCTMCSTSCCLASVMWCGPWHICEQ